MNKVSGLFRQFCTAGRRAGRVSDSELKVFAELFIVGQRIMDNSGEFPVAFGLPEKQFRSFQLAGSLETFGHITEQHGGFLKSTHRLPEHSLDRLRDTSQKSARGVSMACVAAESAECPFCHFDKSSVAFGTFER